MNNNPNIQTMPDRDHHTSIDKQENHNCQQFFGPISGCVFAMPGSTVNQMTPPTVDSEPVTSNELTDDKQIENSSKEDVIKSDNTHIAFARAIVECQEFLYIDEKPYLRYTYDHIVLEHLAAWYGIITQYNDHTNYLRFLEQMTKSGYRFKELPNNNASLSAYINKIDSSDSENWKNIGFDAFTFNRYLAFAKQVRLSYHKHFVLG